MHAQLLGEVRVDGRADGLAKNALFLYLAAHFPEWSHRKDLLEVVKGDSLSDDALNRLRVGLSRLRSSAPLEEVNDRIRLSPDHFTTDRAHAEELIRNADNEPDERQELELLLKLLPELSTELLPKMEWEWIEPLRDSWTLLRTGTLDRIGNLSLRFHEYGSAYTASRLGLDAFPNDESLWEVHLRASIELNDVSACLRKFNRARKLLVLDDSDFSSNLLSLSEAAPKLLTQRNSSIQWSESESNFILTFLKSLLVKDKEAATQLFAHPLFRELMIAMPEDAIRPLEAVLENSAMASEANERVRTRLITAHSLAERSQEVIDLSKEFIQHNPAPIRLRLVLMHMAIAYNDLGDSKKAFETIETAIRVAEDSCSELDVVECKLQRANLLLACNDLEQAFKEFCHAQRFYEEHNYSHFSDYYMILINKSFTLGLLGRFEEADHILVGVDSHIKDVKFDYVFFPIKGFIGASLGRPDAALHFHRGLRSSYRISRRRVLSCLGLMSMGFEKHFPDEAGRIGLLWGKSVKQDPAGVPPIFLGLWEKLPHPLCDAQIDTDSQYEETVRTGLKTLRLIQDKALDGRSNAAID